MLATRRRFAGFRARVGALVLISAVTGCELLTAPEIVTRGDVELMELVPSAVHHDDGYFRVITTTHKRAKGIVMTRTSTVQ